VRQVRVEAGGRPYDVLIGPGAAACAGAMLPAGVGRVAVVTQAAVPVEVAFPVPSERFVVPDGEVAKSLTTVEELCRGFARFGLTRGDAVVGIGGGVVTDVAGLAAALYHRGVAVVHVATTLLAMVDAAVGGKTAVNLPEGKNLVGAYWQPAGVCCDTALLATLPEPEWRSGRGEMVKCALIGAGPLAGLPLEEQVARCVALKAEIVGADERDAGRRMLLNYGHTLGHAVEAAGLAAAGLGTAGAEPLRHGEALAIGLVFAALLARRLGRIDDGRVATHVELVSAEGLPTALPPGSDPELLLELMARDKKATGGLTFVLDGPRGVEVVPGVAVDDVRAALDAMERADA
jgi:5-deoxy-5-amino-3-dehydroquinate synthase